MLPSGSISVVGVKMPEVPDVNNLYELNFDTFQLPDGVSPLDILHRIDHKTPQNLTIPILHTINITCSLTKKSPIATLVSAGKCEQVQGMRWTTLQDNVTAKLLPTIPANTNLQLEPDTNNSCKSILDSEIPDGARNKLKDLLNVKYANVVSQTAMDIGNTNLIELDIPTEGPPIASKPNTVLLKYCEFVDHKIKQPEEAGIITWSISDWDSPLLVVPKKEDHVDASVKTNTNANKNYKFNLRLCINYRKLNSKIQNSTSNKCRW